MNIVTKSIAVLAFVMTLKIKGTVAGFFSYSQIFKGKLVPHHKSHTEITRMRFKENSLFRDHRLLVIRKVTSEVDRYIIG